MRIDTPPPPTADEQAEARVRGEQMIREARALRAAIMRHPPGHIQRTTAYFLALGHYDSLLNRLAHSYRRRRQAMAEAIDALGLEVAGTAAFGGSSFWMRIRKPRLSSSRPMLAVVRPLPSEEATPPVTKTCTADPGLSTGVQNTGFLPIAGVTLAGWVRHLGRAPLGAGLRPCPSSSPAIGSVGREVQRRCACPIRRPRTSQRTCRATRVAACRRRSPADRDRRR